MDAQEEERAASDWSADFDFECRGETAGMGGPVAMGRSATATGVELLLSSSDSSEEGDWDELFNDGAREIGNGGRGGMKDDSERMQRQNEDIIRLRELIVHGAATANEEEGDNDAAPGAELLQFLRSRLNNDSKPSQPRSLVEDADGTTTQKDIARMEADLVAMNNLLIQANLSQRRTLRRQQKNQKPKLPADIFLSDASDESDESDEDTLLGLENLSPNSAFKTRSQLLQEKQQPLRGVNGFPVTASSDSATTSTADLSTRIDQLERRLASASLEIRDRKRSILYHERILRKLYQVDTLAATNGGKLIELVYIVEVLVTLRTELGRFDDAETGLRQSIGAFEVWRTACDASWAAASVNNHIQTLRLRLVRLCLDAGKERMAAVECKSLLNMVVATETSPHKRNTKVTTLRLWLADSLVRSGLGRDAVSVLHELQDRRRSAGTQTANRRSSVSAKKADARVRSACISPPMALKSMYEPEDPPCFGLLTIKCALACGDLMCALHASCALVAAVETLLSTAHRREETVSSWSSKNPNIVLADALVIRARILAIIAKPCCAFAFPVTETPAWERVGVSPEDLAHIGLGPQKQDSLTQNYASRMDAAKAAVQLFRRAHATYCNGGDVYRAQEANLGVVETHLEMLFFPLALQGACRPDRRKGVSSVNVPDTRPPPNTTIDFAELDNIKTVLMASLQTANTTCVPLHVLRCQLGLAELAQVRGGQGEEAMSYWTMARNLFLELFVDGTTLPLMAQHSPLQVSRELTHLLSRLVRFILCSQPKNTINANLLLIDALFQAQIDLERRISAPLSWTSCLESVFTFHRSEDAISRPTRVCVSGDQQYYRGRSRPKSVRPLRDLNQDQQKNTSGSGGICAWSVMFQVRHRARMQQSYSKSLPDEIVREDNQKIILRMATMMASLRAKHVQPGLESMVYETLLASEIKIARENGLPGSGDKEKENRDATVTPRPPSILERLYRLCYAVSLGSSLVVVYAPLTGAKHAFLCGGGREEAAEKMFPQENGKNTPGGAATGICNSDNSARSNITCASAGIRRARLNADSHAFLKYLLLPDGDLELAEKGKVAWEIFMRDCGRDALSRFTSELSAAAAAAEHSNGFSSRGSDQKSSDSFSPAGRTRCSGFFFRGKTPSVSHVRSPAPASAPLIVLQSRSLIVLPFEEIMSTSRGHHHVSRGTSLLSLLSVTWSRRRHRQRRRSHGLSSVCASRFREEKRVLTLKGGPPVVVGASSNIEANKARVPRYMGFSAVGQSARELKVRERYRLHSSLRRVLVQLNHHTRVPGRNSPGSWGTSPMPVSISSAKTGSDLHQRARHAGSHTMHLPFQSPAVGSIEDCGFLSVMHAQSSNLNCSAVVSWVESQVGALRESVFPVILLTYGDLFELSESLLMLMGWVQDCSFLFVPVAIYAKALRILSKVDAARARCLAADKATQLLLMRMISKTQSLRIGSGRARRKQRAIDRLLLKRALPCEWETASSTLEAAVALIREETGMPCVLFNSP